MSNAPVAVVGQNEVVLVATEILLIKEVQDRLLHVEHALSTGRISEEQADELQEVTQSLRDRDERFPQEEEQSGQRLTANTIEHLHRFVWEAPRTIIDDPKWPDLLQYLE
jgi:hypothetical protein